MPDKTTRDVEYDGKLYPTGKAIAFTDDEAGAAAREQLLGLDPPAIIGADAKPLEKMTKAELQAVAEEEGATLPDGATNAQIVEAITAKRAGPAT